MLQKSLTTTSWRLRQFVLGILPDAEIGRTGSKSCLSPKLRLQKKGRLKSPLLLSLLYTSCSIIVHIVLDNIPRNCINSIVVLCSAGIEFNFIFHSTIIILQLCFCKLHI